jgi:hypothetical protein
MLDVLNPTLKLKFKVSVYIDTFCIAGSFHLISFFLLVILQPFKEELPQDFKCKDKFLVQTAPINASFEQQDITSMVSFCVGKQ